MFPVLARVCLLTVALLVQSIPTEAFPLLARPAVGAHGVELVQCGVQSIPTEALPQLADRVRMRMATGVFAATGLARVAGIGTAIAVFTAMEPVRAAGIGTVTAVCRACGDTNRRQPANFRDSEAVLIVIAASVITRSRGLAGCDASHSSFCEWSDHPGPPGLPRVGALKVVAALVSCIPPWSRRLATTSRHCPVLAVRVDRTVGRSCALTAALKTRGRETASLATNCASARLPHRQVRSLW